MIKEDGSQGGIVSLDEALAAAKVAGIDLVEISPNAEPPVCKIMDHGKFVFQQTKKSSQSKKKQKRTQIKKIRIRPMIEDGDYQVKLRNLTRFIEDGDKVEISLRFRGREMAHKDLGMEVLQRLKTDTSEYADVEREPKFEGRQMFMALVPKKPSHKVHLM